MPRTTAGMRMSLIALSILALVILPATAGASPPMPTMGLSELRAKIEAAPGNVLDGYLKTVLRGSTISAIPVRVLAVTSGSTLGPESGSALIFFEATGPEIDRIGGIASGMSGSPLYVSDGGVDRLIGALSYGDDYSKNGAGLATPIEAMTQIESYPTTMAALLDHPATVDGVTRNRVVVTPDKARAAAAGKSAFVVRPLRQLQVGGIRPDSEAFRQLADAMAKQGVELIAPLGGGLGSQISPYSAPFQPGSSMAASLARGDLWLASIGTVTYVNGRNVIGFGHPDLHSGTSNQYLSNAWIDGIWGSNKAPYKIGRPAGLRGTLTQDRLAGVMGVDGLLLDETPVTATAVNADTGQRATSSVMLPRSAVSAYSDKLSMDSILPFLGAAIAGTRLFDVGVEVSGSALTTTTAVVTDGIAIYRIVLPNIRDTSGSYYDDIALEAAQDVESIIDSVQDINEVRRRIDVLSVDLQSELSESSRFAEVVGVEAPHGLSTGHNLVRVSVRVAGIEATQSVDMTLTVPRGLPLSGRLWAGIDPDEDDEDDEDMPFPVPRVSSYEESTTAELIDMLRRAEPNNLLRVGFVPAGLSPVSRMAYPSIEATALTGLYVSYEDGIAKTVPRLTASPTRSTIPYRSRVTVSGRVMPGPSSSNTVTVSARSSGETTDRVLAVTRTAPRSGRFSVLLPPLSATTRVRVHFAGGQESVAAAKSLTVRVRARMRIATSATRVRRGESMTLSARIAPAQAIGHVAFERWNGRRWVTVPRGVRPLVSGVATVRYAPPLGESRLRARYIPSAGASNTSSVSSAVTVRTRK